MGPFGAGDIRYSLGEPQLVSNLMLFPIKASSADPKPRFRTLEEGLADDSVQITEPGGGHSRVGIQNRSGSEVFIIDGEGITGGKQNRIAAASLVIGPRVSKEIPVYCSEHGRWAGSKSFSGSNEIAYPSIRRLSTASRSSRRTARSIQSSIWMEISRKQASLKVRSATQSMQDIYASKEKEMEPELLSYLGQEPPPDQVGVLAATQKRILCIDIFYNHPLFGRFSKKLFISCALESMEDKGRGGGSFDDGRCEEFFHSALAAEPAENPGDDHPESFYKFRAPGMLGVGKVLRYRRKAVHASFFPDVKI